MLQNANEIIEYIGNSKKQTPVKVYLQGDHLPETDKFHLFGDSHFKIAIGDLDDVHQYMEENKALIKDSYLQQDRRNSAIPELDLRYVNARIEPGCTIREHVSIGDNAVIMMGSIINIGAKIGEGTMIDMGVVLGGRAEVGKNCHIGAGAVLAGVIEPPSATPVIVEDNVVIGANAVVIEGVHIGHDAVVGAGSVVIHDVPSGAVVVGNPARVIKTQKDEHTKSKTQLMDDLRKL